MNASREKFFKRYTAALEAGSAALFAGAGLSAGTGYVNWKELLSGVAEELGLNIEMENDLVTLAQYHVTKQGNNRHEIEQIIIEQFKTKAEITPSHEILAGLNIGCVWTTNYDKLLEKSFEKAHKNIDVKVTENQFSLTTPNSDVVIYKMHGDVDNTAAAVITKDDYLSYSATHGFFQTALKADLLNKTFLFLGYSFSDPNIEFMLGSLNLALKGNPRTHFCVMRRPKKHKCTQEELQNSSKMQKDWDEEHSYDCARFNHRKQDLLRYGIETVEIDEYDEIAPMLQELLRRSRLRDVFVSGSAHEYAPLDQQTVESFSYKLGQEIIKRRCNLITGFGLGIGSSVLSGAMEQLYQNSARGVNSTRDMNRRLTLRAFPQPPQGQIRQDMLPLWSNIRSEMISKAGFCIFVAGNKLENNQVVLASGIMGEAGVLGEWQLCQDLKKYPIPIGASGHAARAIHAQVTQNLDKFYPGIDVSKEFNVLGDKNAGQDKWIKAVFDIIDKATKPTN